MGYGRGKDSKSKKSKKEESSSESDSDQSYSSDSSYTSTSDSEPEPSKKQKLDSTSKKKHKKEQKKEKKKEKKKKEKEAKNKISKEDFYNKNTEFRLWLVEEKGKYFDQLTSSKANKAYFKKFVKQWNSRKLAKKYYKGIDVVDARTSLTKYKWKFAEKINADKSTPSPSRKIPSSWKSTPTGMTPPARTFSTFGKAGDTSTIGPSLPKGLSLQQASYESVGKSTESLGPSRPVQGPSRPGQGDQVSPTSERKSPGRSKGRKRRGNSPDADSSYMGTGDDFQNKLAARQKQRDHQKDRAASKLIQYKAREKEKMSKLLELARANKSKDALW